MKSVRPKIHMAFRSLLCSNEIRRLRLTLKEIGNSTQLTNDAPLQENPVLHIKKSIHNEISKI